MFYSFCSPKNILKFVLATTVAVSCTATGPAGIFGKKSPYESYADKIKNAGLQTTALGRLWFAASDQSLTSPLSVNLPYSETGYFAAEQPKAVGLLFKGKRGEKLHINVNKNPLTAFEIYLDLWQPASAPDAKPVLLLSADSTTATITYDINKDGSYIVRLQPELLQSGEYTLSVSAGPSLAFPVTPKVKSNIGSFWGAGRDKGARKHEGIDIFAPRATALVAAADGVVTSVTENTLGGQVVFIRPDNKDYTLYYAHLDQQLVQPGQTVKTGDTIGLMGNTGNARTTSPHLHFGIYTNTGAVDPLPFINRTMKNPDKISAPLGNIGKWVRNNKPAKLSPQPDFHQPAIHDLELNTLLKVEAATAGLYKVSLPDGQKGFVAATAVTAASSPIRRATLKTGQSLLDEPNYFAAKKTPPIIGEPINILAQYKDFYYVQKSSNEEGWIPKKAL